MEEKNENKAYINIWEAVGKILKEQGEAYKEKYENAKDTDMCLYYDGCVGEVRYFDIFMDEENEKLRELDTPKTAVGKLKKVISVEYTSTVKRNHYDKNLPHKEYSDGVEEVAHLLYTEFEKLEKELGEEITPVNRFNWRI